MTRLLSPKSLPALLPAVLGGMAVACPDVLARILLQLVCYLGSLLEPFDTVLPEKGLMRSLVTTVQRAKKAYNVKHGLVTIEDGQFFDEEDDDWGEEPEEVDETHPNEDDAAAADNPTLQSDGGGDDDDDDVLEEDDEDE